MNNKFHYIDIMKFKKLLIYTNNSLLAQQDRLNPNYKFNNNENEYIKEIRQLEINEEDSLECDIITNPELKNINDIYRKCDRNYHYFLFLTEVSTVKNTFVNKLLIDLDVYKPAIMILNDRCKIYHRSVLNYVFPYQNYDEKGESIYDFQKLVEYPLKKYSIKNVNVEIQQNHIFKKIYFRDKRKRKILLGNEYILQGLYEWFKPCIFKRYLKNRTFRETEVKMSENSREYEIIESNGLINFFEYIDINDYFDIKHEYFRGKLAKFYHREIHGDCKLYHFAHDFRMINRNAIINHLIKTQNYMSYLEIGVYNCYHFHDVQIEDKYGVDPHPAEGNSVYEMYKDKINIMTSVDFFTQIDDETKFDMIFIDGCLLEENITFDITEALKHINRDGVVIVHDCNPPTEYLQRDNYRDIYGHEQVIWNNRTYDKQHWQGKTWKAIVKLRETRDDLDVYVVDTDWGVGIIKYGDKTKKLEMDGDKYKYDTLMKNRRRMLNLINTEEFFGLYPLVLT